VQEAKIGGLGIFMVKKSMDDFTYLHDGESNIVVFRKEW
jgi:anti-sigma regulatory factor (Ser/Thr protein kinase)